MNGVHDMGGMDGFGLVAPDPHEAHRRDVIAEILSRGNAGADRLQRIDEQFYEQSRLIVEQGDPYHRLAEFCNHYGRYQESGERIYDSDDVINYIRHGMLDRNLAMKRQIEKLAKQAKVDANLPKSDPYCAHFIERGLERDLKLELIRTVLLEHAAWYIGIKVKEIAEDLSEKSIINKEKRETEINWKLNDVYGPLRECVTSAMHNELDIYGTHAEPERQQILWALNELEIKAGSALKQQLAQWNVPGPQDRKHPQGGSMSENIKM